MHLPQTLVFKSVPPFGSEPNWQTRMLYSDICSLIFVNETICMVICPSTRFKLIILLPGMNHLMPRLSQNASCGWGGLVPLWVLKHSFFSLTDCWWLYNIQLKTSRGGTLSASFWCLCQKLSLSPLYFNKTLLQKSSERSSLFSGPRLNSSPPEAKNPGIFSWFSNNLSVYHNIIIPCGST